MFCLQLRDEVEAKLRYEDREAVANRGLLAVASTTKRLEKLRATRSRKNRAICSAPCEESMVFASLRSQLQSRSEASVNDLLKFYYALAS